MERGEQVDVDDACNELRFGVEECFPTDDAGAPGQQEAVEVGPGERGARASRTGSSGPDRANRAFVPQALERAERAARRFVEVIVGVVDVQHVDAVEGEALEALGDGAEDALLAEAEDGSRPGVPLW